MALGPLARVLVQTAVAGIAILARALPAAYGKALQNARKSGMDAAGGAAAGEGVAAGIFTKKRMKKDEALAVLNLQEMKEEEVDLVLVQKQYDRYFAANAVEKGGSFYLQSKIYRAKEMLDEFIKEKQAEEINKKKNEEKQWPVVVFLVGEGVR